LDRFTAHALLSLSQRNLGPGAATLAEGETAILRANWNDPYKRLINGQYEMCEEYSLVLQEVVFHRWKLRDCRWSRRMKESFYISYLSLLGSSKSSPIKWEFAVLPASNDLLCVVLANGFRVVLSSLRARLPMRTDRS
jgi:hypothetical protein